MKRVDFAWQFAANSGNTCWIHRGSLQTWCSDRHELHHVLARSGDDTSPGCGHVRSCIQPFWWPDVVHRCAVQLLGCEIHRGSYRRWVVPGNRKPVVRSEQPDAMGAHQQSLSNSAESGVHRNWFWIHSGFKWQLDSLTSIVQ